MKRFFIYCVLFVVFLFPALVQAKTYTFTATDFSINTTCDYRECDLSVSYTGKDPITRTISVWKTKGADAPTSDRLFERTLSFKAATLTKPDIISLSVSPLAANTPYYLFFQIAGWFDIHTELSGGISNTKGYGLTFAHPDGSTLALIQTPASEIRTLSLEFKNSNNQNALTQGIPSTTPKTTIAGTTTYSYNFGDLSKQIPLGIYSVFLEAPHGNGTIDTLLGPLSLNVLATDLKASETTYTAGNDHVTAHGKIDPAINKDFKEFNIVFEWNTVNDFSAEDTKRVQVAFSDFSDDGTYTATIPNLNANTTYFVRETITGTAGQKRQTITAVNSTDGIIPLSGQPAQDYKNARTYRLLSPFPKLFQVYDPDYCALQKQLGNAIPVGTICDINEFLNYLLKLLIGFAGIALVLRIMFEGYKILVSDVPYLKVDAKSKIAEAALGLGLVLTAWIILNTINPALVANTITLNDVAVGIENPEGTGSFDFEAIKNLSKGGQISCPNTGGQSSIASIAKSFVGKVSYNQNRRNTVVGGDIYLDCSSYVSTVLDCAGYNVSRDSTTVSIFGANSEKINSATTDYSKNIVNGILLKPGDLIGWPATTKSGHVLLYIGNGTLAEVHGPPYPDGGGSKDGAARTIPLATYQYRDNFTHIKRL